MKRILLYILLLTSLISEAQVINPTPPSSSTFLIKNDKFKQIQPWWFSGGMYLGGLYPITGDTLIGWSKSTGRLGYKYVAPATTYSAGRGLTLNSNTFRLDTSQVYYFDAGLKVTAIKASGQERVLVQDSTTGAIRYKYITSNAGTVTSISLGNGLTGTSPITSTGTIYADTTKLSSLHGNSWGNGMYLGSTNNRSIYWRTNNLQRCKLDSNGLFSVNNPTAASANISLLSLKGKGSTSSTNVFYSENSSGDAMAVVNNVGNFGLGTSTPDIGGFGYRTFTINAPGGTTGSSASAFNMVGSASSGSDIAIMDFYNSSTRIAEINVQPSGSNGGLWKFWVKKNGGSLGTAMTIADTKAIGFQVGTPTAYIHIAAGTTTASTAPLKFTTSLARLTTAAEAGAVEVYKDTLYYTDSSANRYKIGRFTTGNPFLASGTYTPTLTGVTNVTSTTAYVCTYSRVGKAVTVSGKVGITATVSNAQTTIGMSLPITSNIVQESNLGGSGYTLNNTINGHGVGISGDLTNDRANFDYYETHGAADSFSFTFTYYLQ